MTKNVATFEAVTRRELVAYLRHLDFEVHDRKTGSAVGFTGEGDGPVRMDTEEAVRLPLSLGTLLFFAPQLLFGFTRVVRPTEGGFVRLFEEGTAGFACAVFWLVVAIGHFAITRRWRVSLAFATGLAAVVAATVLVHLAFSAFGYSMQLDGP